jgi:hypothetical protein
MHDLIFAIAFVAMVATPAMVAVIGSRKEYNPGPEAPSVHPTTAIKIRPAGPAVRPPSVRKIVSPGHSIATQDGLTLPMHHARGMAGR